MRQIDSLKRTLRALALAALAALGAAPAHAAGTTPLALAVQVDAQGNLMPGCLLYFYVAGTVATPQQVYQDFGLTTPAQNPLSCDASSRVPQHWLTDGLIHLRLTDASGVVVIDTTMQVLGPSGGGGGGGGGTGDPTAVASTGDIKARLSGEVLDGWVVLNGLTIGNSTSGANTTTNTQALFIYLWTNCTNLHCPVIGGRGTSGLADFNASKQLTLPDMRSTSLVGRDCMGTTCATRLLASNITSGAADNTDTPGAGGGLANQTASTTLQAGNVPASLTFTVTVNSITLTGGAHQHPAGSANASYHYVGGVGQPWASGGNAGSGSTLTGLSGDIGSLLTGTGSGTASCDNCGGTAATSKPFAIMPPFKLATWYMKL